MKKAKVQGLDPSDYAYLDSMPTEGWLWEFVRRSQEYRKQYYEEEELKKDRKRYFHTSAQRLQNPLSLLWIFGGKNPSEKWEPKDRTIWIGAPSKSSPVEAVNMNLKIVHKENRYGVQQHEKIDYGTDLNGTVTITTKAPLGHPLNMLLSQEGKQNVIMALIDISAPSSVDEILDTLKQTIVFWRKLLDEPKTRSAKIPKKKKNTLIGDTKMWKSYLIVYDQVKEKLSAGFTRWSAVEEVSNILSEWDDLYLEPKNIKNHYDAAVALINGGYKKYL